MTCAMILRLILYFVVLRYLFMEDDKLGGFLKPVNTLNVSHCKWSFLNFNLWSLWIAKGVIIVQRFAKSYILNIVGPIKLWKTTFEQFYVHWCCYKANNNGPTWVHGTITIFHGPCGHSPLSFFSTKFLVTLYWRDHGLKVIYT